MKFLCALLLFFLSAASLFSQEFIKHATIHFKDSSTASGDFYYYPTLAQSVTLVDSLGEKQVIDLPSIETIQGKSDLYRVIEFNGNPKIFDAIVEGEKVSLYKTNFNENTQFYVFKEGKLIWLEGGDLNYEKDGKNYRKENTRYKGTLKFLLSDNSYVVNKIDGISYFESRITPLIVAYNDGHISYIKTKAIEKQNKVSDWKIVAQYSNQNNMISFVDDLDESIKTFHVGLQYYVSEGSRHSFKFGLEYSQLDILDNSAPHLWNISTSYYYDIYRMRNSNVYFGVRLLDIYLLGGPTERETHTLLRIIPLVGYSHHISNKLDLYVEINHLFDITEIPNNFSFGIAYDL